MEPGAHPTRQPGHRPAHHQLQKAKGSTDSVGGPSRKIEVKVTPAGAKEGIRYYTHGGETIAVRTSKGFSYLINDHQGTAMTAVAMTTLAVTRRRQLPFGQLRSEQTESLPGTRGFVSGTEDPTDLTHLGAREYDPLLR